MMTTHARVYRSLFMLLPMAALLAGAGGSATAAPVKAAAPVPRQLVIDVDGPPSNLDPGLQYNTESYVVYRNMFDQLLARNPVTLAIEPNVATRWKALSPTRWEFTIRSGIHFTNGTALTAGDVAFSLDRIIDPAFGSAQAANFADVTSATASGNTVIINTKVPDPTLLSFLTTLSIVPKAYVQAHGNTYFNLHPIGSGPYELKQWSQGSEVVLTRNPHYWGRPGVFPTVAFRSVPEEATRVADLESGVAQIAMELTPDDVAEINSHSSLKVLSTPTERVAYLAFNADQAPTNSVLMRKAIAYALNVPQMIQALEQGYAKPVKEVLTPVQFGYDSKLPGYAHNATLAKKLLREAHYNGATLTFATSPSYPTTVIQAIQAQLEAVGMNVKIVNTTQPVYLEHVQSPQHNWGNIRFGQWSCSCLDATGTIYPLFYSHSIWSSWSDPSFDKAASAAQSTLNSADRKTAIDQALAILQQQVPGVGLWQAYDIYGVSRNIVWKMPDVQEQFFLDQIGWR